MITFRACGHPMRVNDPMTDGCRLCEMALPHRLEPSVRHAWLWDVYDTRSARSIAGRERLAQRVTMRQEWDGRIEEANRYVDDAAIANLSDEYMRTFEENERRRAVIVKGGFIQPGGEILSCIIDLAGDYLGHSFTEEEAWAAYLRRRRTRIQTVWPPFHGRRRYCPETGLPLHPSTRSQCDDPLINRIYGHLVMMHARRT